MERGRAGSGLRCCNPQSSVASAAKCHISAVASAAHQMAILLPLQLRVLAVQQVRALSEQPAGLSAITWRR